MYRWRAFQESFFDRVPVQGRDGAQPAGDRCSGPTEVLEVAGERFDVSPRHREQRGATVMAELGELAQIERVRIAGQPRVATEEAGECSEFGVGEDIIGEHGQCRGMGHSGSFRDRPEPPRQHQTKRSSTG